MARIKVAVSPFYGGENWTDELTGITFEKDEHAIRMYSIPENVDLTNIRKAIRINALMLVEGTFKDLDEVEKKPEPKVETKVEAKVEAEVEAPKEEKKTEVKKTAAKKSTKSKAKKPSKKEDK